jgi:hypothetical protein
MVENSMVLYGVVLNNGVLYHGSSVVHKRGGTMEGLVRD